MAKFGEPWKSEVKFEWLPSFFRKYLRYVYSTEPAPIHHLGCALALASVAVGGASYIMYGPVKQVKMNLFVGLLAPSGYRKSEALGLAMRLFNKARDKDSVNLKEPMPDITSNVSLMEAADERQGDRVVHVEMGGKHYSFTQMFIVSSEFASFLRARDKDMITLLTNIFDGAVVGEKFTYRTQTGGTFSIHNPYAVLLMASTPEWLSERLPKTAKQGGFINRFLFFYSEQYAPQPFPQSLPDIATLEEEALEDLLLIGRRHVIVNWTVEAQRTFSEWYSSTRGGMDMEDDPELKTWVSRLAIFLIKIAGISALADRRTVIDVQDLDFAWTLMHFARSGVKKVMRLSGHNLDAWLEMNVVDFILKEIRERKEVAIPASLVCRRFAADASAYKVRQLLTALHSLGIVVYNPATDRVAPKFPQAQEYVASAMGQVKELTWDGIVG